jgi:hypothetical protein
MTMLRLREERGGVLALVALSMFVLVLFVTLVVAVANWKEHKRHLQLQADAAALAGAGSFALPNCDDATVETAARDYAGTDASHIARYNDQVASKFSNGYVPNLHVLINSAGIDNPDVSGYYGDPGAGNNSGGSPCGSPPNRFCGGAQGLDVKVTETDLPWLFLHGLVHNIHAHARVCLMQITSSANALPIAVPNPKPKSAAAIFIDYGNNNAFISALPLTDCVGASCPVGMDVWSSAATNVSIAPQTGLVIAVSGLTTLPLTGGLAAICGQPLTTCFDGSNDPPTVGVNFIRGWSNSGSGTQPNPPVLRDVQLFPGTCPGDAYFEFTTANCSATIAAVVDARLTAGSDTLRMGITVTGAGCPNQGCVLAKETSVPASTECAAVMAGGATGKCWKGTIPIRPRQGAQGLTIAWNEAEGVVAGKDCSKGQGCNGTFPGFAQQAYTADDLPTHNISGPLQLAQISSCPNPSCLSPGNSLPTGTGAPAIAVTIGLKGALQNAQNASDPTASCTFDDGSVHPFACLKVSVASGSAGSTQSVNCDPFAPPPNKLEDQLANGCRPDYAFNDGSLGPWSPCPKDNQLDDSTHPQPWKCAALFTGNKINAVGDGMNRRIFGSTNPGSCPAYGQPGHNNWQMFNPNDPSGTAGFPQGDPRIVGVYLTAYGAFTHTAGTSLTIPVTDFATFYVTGYDSSPCTSPFVTDHPDDPFPDKGTLVGHFIKYVDRLNTGGGTTPCNPASFGSCVPVMTR